MREIKFRALDIESKIMYPNIQNHIGNTDSAFGYMIKNKKYSIMQFTGLKDKNDKDIYEGDIVRINNLIETWEHGEPEFDWKVFEIVHNRYTYGFNNSVIYKPLSDYDNDTLEGYDIEIIGNIYENPELLNK